MARMPSWAEEEITPSIWWTLLSRIILRMAGFKRMTSKTGMLCPLISEYQLLGDDCLKYHGQLDGNLSLLAGFGKTSTILPMVLAAPVVCRLEENQMTGFGSCHGSLDGFVITHFAKKDHIRALAQCGAQGYQIAFCIYHRSHAG